MNALWLVAALLAVPKLHVGPPGFAAVVEQNPQKPPASLPRATGWPGAEALLEAVVLNDDRTYENAHLELSPPHKGLPAPAALQLDPETDALLPLPDFWPLPENAAHAILLRYRIPADAKPGRYEHTIKLSADKLPRSQEAVITLNIVEAPAGVVQPLPAIASLRWDSLRDSLTPTALLKALQPFPVALWPRSRDSLSLRPEDIDAFAAAQAAMETVAPLNLGPILPAAEAAQPRGFSARVDAAKLERWPQWAEKALWAFGAYVELRIAGGEDAGTRLLATLTHWKEQWPRLRVMLVGPYIPALQPLADAWALPPEFASVAAPLAEGHLAAAPSLALESASPGLPLPAWPELSAGAAFALDGSEATYWLTTPLLPAYIELRNASGARFTQLEVVGDRAPTVVQAALPAQPMGDSTVSWREAEDGHWLGTFRYPAPFERLRLQFPASQKSSWRVREIRLAGEAITPATVDPVAPWLMLDPAQRPDLLYATILIAEASGCAGLYLGEFQLRDIRQAIEPLRKGAPPTLAYTDGSRLHAAASLPYLSAALQDAALLRSLRRQGKLSANAAANFLANAQRAAAPPREGDEPGALLKQLRDQREQLLQLLQPAK